MKENIKEEKTVTKRLKGRQREVKQINILGVNPRVFSSCFPYGKLHDGLKDTDR